MNELTTEDVSIIAELLEHRRQLAVQVAAISNKKLAEKFETTLSIINKIATGVSPEVIVERANKNGNST